MLAIVVGTGYFLLHFAVYALILRRIPALRSERAIFLLHFTSFCALTAAVFLLILPDGIDEALTVTAAVASLHGIYSLSFLELWSLAEGSFSFQILATVEAAPASEAGSIVQKLGEIGDGKKESRISSLGRLGFIRQESGMVALTARGRCLAFFLRTLQQLANLRDTG